MSLKTFQWELSKNMTIPFLWQLKKFGYHLKNNDNKMAIENFRLL